MTQSTRTPALISPIFCAPSEDPYSDLTFTERRAIIKDYSTGEAIFEQYPVLFPDTFSDTAVNIIASKYFKGKLGTPEREFDLRQMIDRVVGQIVAWGMTSLLSLPYDRVIFRRELAYLLSHQMVSFNSPVWFNVGVPNTNGTYYWDGIMVRPTTLEQHKPQTSACFILSVEDSIEDILQWYVKEGRIFSNGSGAGTNLSKLRGSMEYLSGGGKASGPVSFMRPADANGSTIKSGGKTRRAAKMVILNADHPDIEEFVTCKAQQEQVAKDLIGLGYNPDFSSEKGAYSQIYFQNANHSVRVPDAFMHAVRANNDWELRSSKTGEVISTVKAKTLFEKMAEAAWMCGDPGIQFDTTCNEWHTCKTTGRLNASNPCSEYMFLDDSACNLASLNLVKFFDSRGHFQLNKFKQAVRITILAQELLVDNSGYPTQEIARNSHAFRPLGLGYTNLGACLMQSGLAYDSEAGRAFAATVTAAMTGFAYEMSADIAEIQGPFEKFEENKLDFIDVLKAHSDKAHALLYSPKAGLTADEHEIIHEAWNNTIIKTQANGIRNAQVTVLAPTGTISFMMDCDTTGIEPELSLVKYKTLVGGGTIKIVNQSVVKGLYAVNTLPSEISRALQKIEESEDFSPFVEQSKLAVFDTSFPHPGTGRSIHYSGHINMMAAVQPFLSGAISKTVNMPSTATPEEIAEVYISAWIKGLKCVAIYRDGCKTSQPLSTTKAEAPVIQEVSTTQGKLEGDRPGIIHEFKINGHKGFLTVGLYPDGRPAEIFVDIAKEGSTVSGLVDTVAILTSFNLQAGVSLQKLVNKFSYTKFEPSGYTKELGYAHSIVDYIFRWLGKKFLTEEAVPVDPTAPALKAPAKPTLATDAPPCSNCGSITQRQGTCYLCPQCGTTTGCS